MQMIYIILILVALYMLMNKDGYTIRAGDILQKPPSIAAPYKRKDKKKPVCTPDTPVATATAPTVASGYEMRSNDDGTRTSKNADGTVTIMYTDGTSTSFPAGSSVNPDGSVVVTNSDGTQTLNMTNGTYTLYMPGNFLSAVDHIGYPSTIGGSRRFAAANERGYPYIIPKVQYPFNNSSVEPDVIQTKMSIMKNQSGSIGQIIPS
jgi:hypothetical protein